MIELLLLQTSRENWTDSWVGMPKCPSLIQPPTISSAQPDGRALLISDLLRTLHRAGQPRLLLSLPLWSEFLTGLLTSSAFFPCRLRVSHHGAVSDPHRTSWQIHFHVRSLIQVNPSDILLFRVQVVSWLSLARLVSVCFSIHHHSGLDSLWKVRSQKRPFY